MVTMQKQSKGSHCLPQSPSHYHHMISPLLQSPDLLETLTPALKCSGFLLFRFWEKIAKMLMFALGKYLVNILIKVCLLLRLTTHKY